MYRSRSDANLTVVRIPTETQRLYSGLYLIAKRSATEFCQDAGRQLLSKIVRAGPPNVAIVIGVKVQSMVVVVLARPEHVFPYSLRKTCLEIYSSLLPCEICDHELGATEAAWIKVIVKNSQPSAAADAWNRWARK